MNYENLQQWIMNKLDEDEYKYEESKEAAVTIMENIKIVVAHIDEQLLLNRPCCVRPI